MSSHRPPQLINNVPVTAVAAAVRPMWPKAESEGEQNSSNGLALKAQAQTTQDDRQAEESSGSSSESLSDTEPPSESEGLAGGNSQRNLDMLALEDRNLDVPALGDGNLDMPALEDRNLDMPPPENEDLSAPALEDYQEEYLFDGDTALDALALESGTDLDSLFGCDTALDAIALQQSLPKQLLPSEWLHGDTDLDALLR